MKYQVKVMTGAVIGCAIQHRFMVPAIKDVIKANEELLDHLFENDDKTILYDQLPIH